MTYIQLTVIMCSDGEVGKDNAKKGHSHWKDFVNSNYLKCHEIVPFVECIGISSDHDADVLDGFIIDDAAGNYCKCISAQTIRSAFENAQNETMGRSATKLRIEFPLNVTSDVYDTKNSNKFTLHDLIVTNDYFSNTFWISLSDFNQQTIGNDDGLYLIVNGKKVGIEIKQVTDDQECQYEVISFYEQVLKDMLFQLRTITNAETLKNKAKEIENELNGQYLKIFESVTAEPAEKKKLQNEIQELLVVSHENNGDDEKNEDLNKMRLRRAELMKRYKQMNRIWKKHRRVIFSFQNTLSCLKSVVREIILGQTRMQEIRQHILDLHFNKKHEKRISKLVMTDDQLAQRQAQYDQIEAPKEEDCKEISDEVGSGCYLSTLSKRECVMDADPLWICGRVSRYGGAAVSNPELIRIEYISPDLVSDSYFKMALEATENNKGFADCSRELINCRLFPIYANLAHMKCSKPFLNESLSHTLSGRMDIRLVDYNSLCAVIGHMICHNTLSYKNVKRILCEIVPSFKLFCDRSYCRPYKLNSFSRETDSTAPRIKLSKKNRQRLTLYTQSFKARTTALANTAKVLFADRLMNLDIDFNDQLYLSIIMKRMRGIFDAQIPKKMDEVKERLKVEANHKMILEILICGMHNDQTDDGDDEKEIEFDASIGYKKRQKAYCKLFDVPHVKPTKLDDSDDAVLAKWNVKTIKASTKKMISYILSRIEVRDLIQSKMFFDTLSKLKSDSFDEFGKNEFAVFDKIPNDFNILLKQIGFGNSMNVLRAICCVAIVCHSNRLWQSNLYWFGDDETKQIFESPESVLLHIYKHFVIKNQRHDYNVFLDNQRREEMIAIHSDPVLPDDIDEYGNLPQFRCGWTKCGRIFTNRDQLLDHVSKFIPRVFVHRFHLKCGGVLEQNPDMTLKEFIKRAYDAFDPVARKNIDDAELIAYYNQFRPLFNKGCVPIDGQGRSGYEPGIISNSNPYYFDKLVKVQKF